MICQIVKTVYIKYQIQHVRIRMKQLTLMQVVLMAICVCIVAGVKINKGWLTLNVATGERQQEYEVAYNARLRETLELTQSSKIEIKAKLTFSASDFLPEFFSFRLRHPQYDNISEPVLASYDEESGAFKALIDLGDPKQIRHMSGDYKLEIIISDDRFDTQTRNILANCKVTFRYSLDQPLPNELKYTAPSIIMTQPPASRVDPPALFTGFIVVVLVGLFVIFVWGLSYQKVNLKMFPSDGAGLFLNFIFLGCLGLVLFMLFKFWISWTFIETIQYFLLGILPISLAANYAFVHIKKN